MNKTLSICVPSFNMEDYLSRCVDSLISSEVLDELEIIIVNDGSTDNTLAIANKYRESYPQSILVIDKPNGHYGSCVNASIKVATGKYFRIVDADDWVDSKALSEFVHTLKMIDVDCVCTRFTIHDTYNNTQMVIDHKLPIGRVLDLNSQILPGSCMRMHMLTYALNHLKRINYIQTEGICYTDTEYVYLPLRSAKTMYCMDLSLYQYFTGRDEQSVSHASMKKNITHYLLMCEKMTEPFGEDCNSNAAVIRDSYLRLFGKILCEIYLLCIPYKKELDSRLRSLLNKIQLIDTKVYKDIEGLSVHGFHYVRFWLKHRCLSRAVLPVIRIVTD